MQVASSRWLRDDAAESEVRGVCLDGEGQIRLEVLQNWRCCEGLLEATKSCTGRRTLGKLDFLACKSSQGGCQRRVVANELLVEVGETQEGLHLLHGAGDRPVQDG